MRACKDNLPRIHMLVEEELESSVAEPLKEHISSCPDCGLQLEKLAGMKSLIEQALARELTAPDVTGAVVRRVSQPDRKWQERKGSLICFIKKALAGATVCLVTVILAVSLFVHFYFQKTFSYDLSETVIRCSNSIQRRSPGAEGVLMRPGDKLERGSVITTAARTQSFISLDGVRLWAEGKAQVEVNGPRAFSLQYGEVYLASAEKETPVTVALENISVLADTGVFRIAKFENDVSLSVASGTLDVTTADGITHTLKADQTAIFGEKQEYFKLAYGKVANPFMSLKASVIDRIKQRFAKVISEYLPDYPLVQHATRHFKRRNIMGMMNRPQGMLQFVSHTLFASSDLTQVKYHALSDDYEALFVPSNRSISIGEQRTVLLSPGKAPTYPTWSYDGSMLAFMETSPYSLTGRARVVRLDDLENPWDISQECDTVRPMFGPTWAPDDRHVLFQVETGPTWDERGPTGNFAIKIAPVDPTEEPLRNFDSPFYDIPLPLPLPVGKTISPSILKLPWGDAMMCANWGNMAYIPVERDGQSVANAPGLFLSNFNPRELFVMGGGFSPSGSSIFFTAVKNLDFNAMNTYILYDVEDILDGFSLPPRSFDDPRIKQVAPTENVQFSAGFSFDESLVFFHEDVNDAFDARWPTDILRSDFDVFYANALPGEPGMPTQIHLPGNQMFLTPSPEGNRMAYCNYEGNNYELRVVGFDITADIDVELGGVLIDNSGTSLIVPPGAFEHNFKVAIRTPFSAEYETEVSHGENRFFAARLIDAQGLENPRFIEPMTLTIRYTDDEVAGLQEDALEIYYYDESDPERPAWISLGGVVEPEHNEITVEIRHFSKFCVGGKSPD